MCVSMCTCMSVHIHMKVHKEARGSRTLQMVVNHRFWCLLGMEVRLSASMVGALCR